MIGDYGFKIVCVSRIIHDVNAVACSKDRRLEDLVSVDLYQKQVWNLRGKYHMQNRCDILAVELSSPPSHDQLRA